jgi:hypothetical protein
VTADAVHGSIAERSSRASRPRTVVVKLSYFPPGDNSMLEAETFAFMAAASAWQAR